ncbi:adenylate/guanylate cyclase domain-containing protein [Sulfuricurvum sp.]|uniref:CHASE2 domain-containing protein n=1 Tax=Sulfuricurvum sp. TaxID=2025608 RepID=UPI002E302523|nr:adenylate/guanylate cyclase domain-containing protein [Sulfuricurvum sp.]HEX5329828.1 adenylate/guanylate cyclase domain-containing protein [Sulfuricurvum sp.]
MKIKIYQAALWAFVCTLSLYFFGKSPFLQTFENKLWDVRVANLQNAEDHDKSIKLILIDQSSLDWAKENYSLSWPWPREMYAKIIDYCVQHGAKAVVFDVLFQEPSLYGVEDDKRLISALEHANGVGSFVLSRNQGNDRRWPSEILKPSYPPLSEDLSANAVYPLASFPDRAIAKGYKQIGSVNSHPDSDGIIRKAHLTSVFDLGYVPSLPMAACLSTKECAPSVDTDLKIINYYGPAQTYETINAASIVQAQLSNEAGDIHHVKQYDLNQSYVFIGMSAPGLMDLKSVPMQNIYPGTEINAAVLDNILHQNFISELPYSITYSLLFLVTFVTFFGIRHHISLKIGLLYSAILLTLAVASSIVLYYGGFWFNVSIFILGIIASWFVAFSINYFHEGAQRRFIKSAFARYISPQVIDELIKYPDRLRLGGSKEVLTILFTDIEGFTAISSKLEPEVLAKFLNEYLGLMSDVILEAGGTIDKYEGDAIIAFWNAPLHQKDHAKRAVASVLNCQRAIQAYNPMLEKKYGFSVRTRFGIHTGEVIVGNFGTEKRFDYTFIGDAGNLASRLESANKQFGSSCMMSEETKMCLNRDDQVIVCRELGTIQVVGRTSGVKVFEPIDSALSDEYIQWIDEYNSALEYFYHADFERALSIFDKLSSIDRVSASYVRLIHKIATGNLKFENATLILDEK